MNWKHPLFRVLAIYVMISMSTLTPLAGIGRAEAAIGVKTLIVGGLVGGAALLALGALSGPAGAIGAVGAAGTGFSGLMGGAVGGLTGGVGGMVAGLGTLGTIALGIGGALLGAHFLGPLMASISPMILIPALLVGGGLLVYSFMTRQNRMGSTYDERFGGIGNNSLVNAGSRLANRSESGTSGSSGATGFLDRFRSVFDRDRRDDTAWWDQRYVDQSGYVRYNTDFWGKLDRFLNGRSNQLSNANALSSGIGYGNTLYVNPGSNVPVDQTGRVTMGGTSSVQSVSRAGLTPQAPTTLEKASDSEDVDESLEASEARRKAAYEKLVEVLKRKQTERSANGTAEASVGTDLRDPEVAKALADYREADRELKELTGRLQPQEKQ